MACFLKEGQGFNILINDDTNPNVQGEGNKAYIRFTASFWGANKNPEGSEKPYKEKGDENYEPPMFVTAFGGTAVRISNAMKVAISESKKNIPFILKSGTVKNTTYVDDNVEEQYRLSVIFNEVNEYAGKSTTNQAINDGVAENTLDDIPIDPSEIHSDDVEK
jgi:hypothetical protein